MKGVFYKIVYKNKVYIGEYSSTSAKDFIRYHLERCLPWTKGPSADMDDKSSRWEQTLYEDAVKNGFAAIFPDMQFSAMTFDTGVNWLQQSMSHFLKNTNYQQNLYHNGIEMYNDIVNSYGVSSTQFSEIRVPEMLLILLESKKHSEPLWNLHANYGPRNGQINKNSIPNIINEKVIQAREKANSRISVWYSFNLEKIPEDIEIVSKKIFGNRMKFDVANPKNKEALSKINHVVKNTTLDSLFKQLNNLRKKLETDPDINRRNLVSVVDDAIDEIGLEYGYTPKKGKQKSSVSTHKQLRTLINDLKKSINTSAQEKMFFTPAALLKEKIRIWLDWIMWANNDAPYQTIAIGQIQQWYKELFTQTMSDILTKTIPYNPKYSDTGGWLDTQINQYGEFLSLSQYYEWYLMQSLEPPTKEEDDNSLMRQLSDRKDTFDLQMQGFIKTNWPLIYAEQIYLWLKTNHPGSYLLKHRTVVSGYKRDVNSYEDIIYY